jgi:hypothetical protein
MAYLVGAYHSIEMAAASLESAAMERGSLLTTGVVSD